MSKAKWFVVRKPSIGEIIATSANQICATEIPWRYKNVVLYSSEPFSSWNVDGGLGTRLLPYQPNLDCATKMRYKNVVLYLPDPFSSLEEVWVRD